MSHELIESPIINFESTHQRRGAVVYLGHKMFPSTAARMAEYRADMRKLADQGLCIADASKRLGFVEDTVRRWAKVFKITFNKKRKRKVNVYPKHGWEDALRAGAAKGETYAQVAERLGVPIINVYRFRKRLGLNWKELKKLHAQKN